jgi:mannosyltransferase
MQGRSLMTRSRLMWPSLVIGILTCLALAPGLDQGFWRDETATADVAIRSWSQLFGLLPHAEGGFAGYEILIHAWVAVFGTSEIAFRLPSLIATFGTIMAAGLLSARLGRRWAGPAASLLIALNHSLTSYYGLEARGYALGTSFVCLAAVMAHRAGQRRRGRYVAAFACFAAVAVTMNFLIVLSVAALLLWLVPVLRERPRLAWWLLLPFGTSLTMAGLSAQARALQAWISVPSPHDVILIGAQVVRPATGLAAVGLAVAWLLVRQAGKPLPPGAAPRVTRRDLLVLAAWGATPPLVLVAYSFTVTPILLERYLLPCMVPIAILVSVALDAVVPILGAAVGSVSSLRVNAARAFLALGAIAGAAFSVHQGAFRPAARPADLRAASNYITSHERPGDAIFYAPSWMEADFRWYLTDRPTGPVPRDVTVTGRSAAQDDRLYLPSVSQTRITDRLASAQRVWIVGGLSLPTSRYRPIPDPGDPVATSIRGCWRQMASHDIGSNTVIELWEPASPAAGPAQCLA